MELLKEKVAIITGGSRGIGRACCIEFAKQGARVVFTYQKGISEARSLEEELRGLGGECLSLQADIKSYPDCQRVASLTLERFGKVDILVNNAGIVRDRALFLMSREDWQEVIDTNLGGVFNMTRATITTFLKQKRGCILNMSSVSGLRGIARQTNYSASKAGIIGFSKALAKEVAAYGVRVNAVCPGFIATDMLNSLREEIKKEILEIIPMKRVGLSQEVAYLCVFLASDLASYITGEAIRVDGGLGT